MRLEIATPELLNSEYIKQIIPIQMIEYFISCLSDGIIINMIVEKETNKSIGFIALVGDDKNELMAFVHQDFKRNGYALNASLETIKQGFEKNNLTEIKAVARVNSSGHLLAKKVGLLDQKISADGNEIELLLPRNVWESNSNILQNCIIEVKQPADFSDDQIFEFHSKVLEGGKVLELGLLDRIKNCELLAFCYHKDNLVGVSAVKRPSMTYVNDIIAKAKIERKFEDLNFEIGYSYTSPNFRRKGISKELKKELLNQMKTRKGKIFSTTAINSSQKFLQENGFVNYGVPYDGKNDNDILYFEKTF